MMNYEVVSKILKYDPLVTEVRIRTENPYTFITRDLYGDRINSSDESVIKDVLDVLVSEVNPTSEIQKLKEEIIKVNERTNIVAKSVLNFTDLDSDVKDEIVNSYLPYENGKLYEGGNVVNYNGELYEVIEGKKFISQNDWLPDSTPSLYKKYLNFNTTVTDETGTPVDVEIINEFVKPKGEHDAYNIGQKVRFEGAIYESVVDKNAFSPSEWAPNWKKIS